MAELHVQPKKASNRLLWLLIALAAIVLIYFLWRGSTPTGGASTENQVTDSTGSGDVATTTPVTNAPAIAGDNVDSNSAAVNYDEITDKDVSVEASEGSAVYSLGKNILFDVGKSTIRPDAESKLKQISSSLAKRYPGASIDVYGYADSTGDADKNKELSEARAAAVKSWIAKNGGMDEHKITLHAMGESNPVASNNTQQGKKENRSVQIVARKQ